VIIANSVPATTGKKTHVWRQSSRQELSGLARQCDQLAPRFAVLATANRRSRRCLHGISFALYIAMFFPSLSHKYLVGGVQKTVPIFLYIRFSNSFNTAVSDSFEIAFSVPLHMLKVQTFNRAVSLDNTIAQ
jgi:hypothetical protein